jgi:hypothetical protein
MVWRNYCVAKPPPAWDFIQSRLPFPHCLSSVDAIDLKAIGLRNANSVQEVRGKQIEKRKGCALPSPWKVWHLAARERFRPDRVQSVESWRVGDIEFADWFRNQEITPSDGARTTKLRITQTNCWPLLGTRNRVRSIPTHQTVPDKNALFYFAIDAHTSLFEPCCGTWCDFARLYCSHARLTYFGQFSIGYWSVRSVVRQPNSSKIDWLSFW